MGIRIPKSFLDIFTSDEVNITQRDNGLFIEPIRKQPELKLSVSIKTTREELLSKLDKENSKLEWFDSAKKAGKEIW